MWIDKFQEWSFNNISSIKSKWNGKNITNPII